MKQSISIESVFPIISLEAQREYVNANKIIFENQDPIRRYEDGKVPRTIYIGGIHLHEKDDINGESFGSLIIISKITNEIVCEYSEQYLLADTFYENCRKLLLFYNCIANYENFNKGILTYFEQHHCDYLLADTPAILTDDIMDSKKNRDKGIFPTIAILRYCCKLINEWLCSEWYEDKGKTMLNSIKSLPLLEELIEWHNDEKFSRVMALGYALLLK